MFRYATCLVAVLFAGASLQAGELDREFGTKVPSTPAAAKTDSPAVPPGTAASELDDESPAQAHRRGWRGGWYGGWGRGWGVGYGGWGRGWDVGHRGGYGGYRGGWYGGSRVGFSIGWGGGYGYPSYGYYAPAYSYYSYPVATYSYYGYPAWDHCWW